MTGSLGWGTFWPPYPGLRVLVPSEAVKSCDWHHGLQKHIASQTCMHRAIRRGPRSWKFSGFEHEIEIFKRDWYEWHFQARLKISSEDTHQTPIFVGKSQGQDWTFQARLMFSSESLRISSESLKFSSVHARLVFVQDSRPLGLANLGAWTWRRSSSSKYRLQQQHSQFTILTEMFRKQISSRNKLPFRILAWPPGAKCMKEAFSYIKNCTFLQKKCIFLQKNALSCRRNAYSCRKMYFPAENCGFWGAHGLCLTGGLLTGGFRNWMTRDVGTSVSARHPDVTPFLPISPQNKVLR